MTPVLKKRLYTFDTATVSWLKNQGFNNSEIAEVQLRLREHKNNETVNFTDTAVLAKKGKVEFRKVEAMVNVLRDLRINGKSVVDVNDREMSIPKKHQRKIEQEFNVAVALKSIPRKVGVA